MLLTCNRGSRNNLDKPLYFILLSKDLNQKYLVNLLLIITDYIYKYSNLKWGVIIIIKF